MTINITHAMPMHALMAEDEEGNIYLRLFVPEEQAEAADLPSKGLLLQLHKDTKDTWTLHRKETAQKMDEELVAGLARYTVLRGIKAMVDD